MSPVDQIDARIEAEGKLFFSNQFWERLEKTFSSSPLFDELEKILQEPEPLDWYSIRNFDLSTARNGERIADFDGEGDIILVISFTGRAEVSFDSPNADSFDLATYKEIKHSYTELYLSNAAQSGALIRILFGRGDWGLTKRVLEIDLHGNVPGGCLSLSTHLLEGSTWTDNSPAPGSVAWTGLKVIYRGLTYAIADGSTKKAYIWWDFSRSTTTFQTSNVKPTLTDDDFVVCYNDAGMHELVWNATLIQGRMIRTGSIFTEELAAGAVTAPKINVPGLDGAGGVVIEDGTVTAPKINVPGLDGAGDIVIEEGVVTTPKLAAGAATAPKINVPGLDGAGVVVIEDGAVTAPKLNITDLADIANLLTVAEGKILAGKDVLGIDLHGIKIVDGQDPPVSRVEMGHVAPGLPNYGMTLRDEQGDVTMSRGSFTWKIETGIKVFREADQTIPDFLTTRVDFDEKDYDIGDDWDSVNKRFVARKTGYYDFDIQVYFLDSDDNARYAVHLYKNGVLEAYHATHGYSGSSPITACLSGDVALDAGDYLEVKVYHNQFVDATIGNGRAYTYFCVAWIGAPRWREEVWSTKAEWEEGVLDKLYCPIGMEQLELAYDELAGTGEFIFDAGVGKVADWFYFSHFTPDEPTIWRDDFREDSRARYTTFGAQPDYSAANHWLEHRGDEDESGLYLPASVSVKNLKFQVDFRLTERGEIDEPNSRLGIRWGGPSSGISYDSWHVSEGGTKFTKIRRYKPGQDAVLTVGDFEVPRYVWRTHHFEMNGAELLSYTDEGSMEASDGLITVAGRVYFLVNHGWGYMNNVLVEHYTLPDPANTSVSFQFATSDNGIAWSPWQDDIADCADSRYLKIKASLGRDNLASAMPVLKDMRIRYFLKS